MHSAGRRAAIGIGLWLLAVNSRLEPRNCAGLELRFDGLCGLESCRVRGLRLGCWNYPRFKTVTCGSPFGPK